MKFRVIEKRNGTHTWYHIEYLTKILWREYWMNAAVGKYKFCYWVGSTYYSLEDVERTIEKIKQCFIPTIETTIKEIEI